MGEGVVARGGQRKRDRKERRRGWIYASFVHVRYTRGENEWSVNYGTLERELTRTPTSYTSTSTSRFSLREPVVGTGWRGVFYLLFQVRLCRKKFHFKKPACSPWTRRARVPVIFVHLSFVIFSFSPMNSHSHPSGSLVWREREKSGARGNFREWDLFPFWLVSLLLLVGVYFKSISNTRFKASC